MRPRMPGVAAFKRIQDLAQFGAVYTHLACARGVAAQDGRDADRRTHGRYSFQKSVKASYRAGIVTLGPTLSAMASSVFSPSPELITTVSTFGSSSPSWMSFAVTPTVTPPAVSAKMPSVLARRRMLATTASSSTSATTPPVRRTTSSTYGPSAGLPMASDLAMVSGRTGATKSSPARYAAATGEQPVAWAPNTL